MTVAPIRWAARSARRNSAREVSRTLAKGEPSGMNQAVCATTNRRGRGRKWPQTKYRRQMVKRFRKKPRGARHRRVYGQRWQVESAFSRHKRRLGSSLGGRSDASRERECHLRVLTHNLMLLAGYH